MATTTRLLLLGAPELWQAQRTVLLPTRKLWGLLAYLAVEGPTERGKLAEILWDNGEQRARANLRTELYRLKKMGLGQVVAEHPNGLMLGKVQHDLNDFEGWIAKADWEKALHVRRDVFLKGCQLEDASAFDEWLSLTRAKFEERFVDAMVSHAESLEQKGDNKGALQWQQRVAQLDPWREEAQRAIMRLHLTQSEPALALEQYQRYKTLLREELGLEPSQAMQSGLQDLLGNRHLHHPARTTVLLAPQTDLEHLGAVPLVGRDTLLFQLQHAAQPLVVLVGAAGAGKSRLVQAFVSAQTGQAVVLWHRELTSATGLAGVIEAIATRLENGWQANTLEPVWLNELARVLPELQMGSGLVSEPDPDRLQAACMRALLQGLGRNDAVVLEDLHWADESTLRFLPQLVRRAAKQGVQVVATLRPEWLEDTTSSSAAMMQRVLGELEREKILVRFEVKDLAEKDVLQLVQRLSGATGATIFARRLHQATLGNPFYVLETLRALFDRGELQADKDGWHTPFDQDTSDYQELSLPQSVLQSMRERLQRFGPLVKRLAEVLSLVARNIDHLTLAAILRTSPEQVLVAAEQLEKAGLVQSDKDGLALTHDLARQALRDALSKARRVALHARLAEVLPQHPNRAGLGLAVLRHAEEAARFDLACQWAERAALESLGRHAHGEAVQLFERGLKAHAQLAPDVPREVRLRLSKEDALRRMGAHNERRSELEALLKLELGNDQQDEVFFRFGRMLSEQGDPKSAARYLKRSRVQHAQLFLVRILEELGTLEGAFQTAETVYAQPSKPEHAFEAAILLAELSFEHNRYADVEGWFSRAETHATQNTQRLRLLQARAQHAMRSARLEEAVDLALLGENLAASVGALFEEAACANARSLALIGLARYGEALVAMEKVARTSEQIGSSKLAFTSRINTVLLCCRIANLERAFVVLEELQHLTFSNELAVGVYQVHLGLAHAYSGSALPARDAFAKALEVFEKTGASFQRASAFYGLALAHLMLGEAETCEHYARLDLEIERQFPNNDWLFAQVPLVMALLLQGRNSEALAASSEAMDVFLETGHELPPEQILWAHALAQHANQHTDAAKATVQRAKNQLERSLGLIAQEHHGAYKRWPFNQGILGALDGVWPDPPRLL